MAEPREWVTKRRVVSSVVVGNSMILFHVSYEFGLRLFIACDDCMQCFQILFPDHERGGSFFTYYERLDPRLHLQCPTMRWDVDVFRGFVVCVASN